MSAPTGEGPAGLRTVRRLGRGGMGVVDLAVDDAGHEVALKRLSLHGTPEEVAAARGRIRREAEVLQHLDHPCVIGLLEVLDDGDDLVLVMPYLSGGNLAQRVADAGPLPTPEVEAMAARLLDGLAHAHAQGVVHRDIKPANVLFDAAGNAYLADFGAASTRDATVGLTGPELVVGTPGFMAPEQARGDEVTAAADVFSLGATLRFAATGSGAYGTGEPRVLMYRAAQDRVEKLPSGLPRNLRQLLSPMLARQPERRPTAASLRPSGPGGTWPHTRPRPAVGRRRAAALATAGGAAALLVAGAIWWRASASGTPSAASRTAAPTTEPAPACRPLPYQPCGSKAPAPFTDGSDCIDGHLDLDRDPSNGCEAAPHPAADPVFRDGVTIRANLVPGPDVTYPMPVADHRQLTCDGTLHVTLTAPRGATMRLEVLDPDGTRLASAVSADGTSGTTSTREGHCLTSDAGTYRVRVSWLGTERTDADFRLTRSGSF